APLGRPRRGMRPFMDVAAYIALPLEVAMMRKLRREVNWNVRERGPQAGIDRLNGFFEEFLDGPVREAYLAANRSARESADIILDGQQPLDELAAQIVREASALRDKIAR